MVQVKFGMSLFVCIANPRNGPNTGIAFTETMWEDYFVLVEQVECAYLWHSPMMHIYIMSL